VATGGVPVTTADVVEYVRARWRFVVAQAVAVLLAVLLVVAVTQRTSHTRTTEFVLHPEGSAAAGDVTNAIDVLDQDGALVQTVVRLLGSNRLLARTGEEAGVDRTAGLSIAASVAPASNVFAVTLTGRDVATLDALDGAIGDVAAEYVESSYNGFELTVLDRASSTSDPFPPGLDLVVLALLLGAAAAVVELLAAFAWSRYRAREAGHEGATGTARADGAAGPAADGRSAQLARRGNGAARNGEAAGVPAKSSGGRQSRRRSADGR
jgi:hypothetical protein